MPACRHSLVSIGQTESIEYQLLFEWLHLTDKERYAALGGIKDFFERWHESKHRNRSQEF